MNTKNELKKLVESNQKVDRRVLDEVAALKANLPSERMGAQYSLGRSFDSSTAPPKKTSR